MKTYSFDELCESQDFNHDQKFVTLEEAEKWERIVRCPYEHLRVPLPSDSRGFCNKCGWFQSMNEVVSWEGLK